MTRSVLLLRAVNVSGRNRVPMAQLRELLAPVLGEVSTYIASGNIVCEQTDDATSACARVRALIAGEFDVDTPVILRTHDELVQALDAHPFGGASEKLLHAMFLEAPAAPGAVEALQERLVPGSGSRWSATTCGSTTPRAVCTARGSPRPSSTARSASPARRATSARCESSPS